MLTYLRYTLATVCFAASVGCLALWWRSYTYSDLVSLRTASSYRRWDSGRGTISTYYRSAISPGTSWEHSLSYELSDETPSEIARRKERKSFGRRHRGYRCPIWYPALIFALAGVAALRFRRQFSIRSALVAVSVVAALLGMAVVL